MKAWRVLIIAVFFILTLGSTKVNGQTFAVGHVFAEVVESVSASSATISNFELAKSTETVSASLQAETLNLGAITINTGRNITCNIVLTPASLKDEEGNSLIMDTAVKNEMLAAPVGSNGIQTIQLGATPAIAQDQALGNYEGSYTVIFAYN
ncbi:MAG TPA: DUF4402 domain-containing protein [Prolixibacteraceae bacterium]|nr:DUF4402 domain-containing protein [Prolixibacteraceae bacterium]